MRKLVWSIEDAVMRSSEGARDAEEEKSVPEVGMCGVFAMSWSG